MATTPQIQHEPTPQVLQRGVATVSRLALSAYTADATVIAATSGTYSLALNGTVIASGNTSSATGYTAVYSVTVPDTYELGAGYVETWTLVGVDSPIVREVYLCLTDYRSTVVEADLARAWRDRFVDPNHPVSWYLQKSWEACWRKIASQGRFPFLSMSPYRFTDVQMAWIYATGYDSNPNYANNSAQWWERWRQGWKDMIWTEADTTDGDDVSQTATACMPGIAMSSASSRWSR